MDPSKKIEIIITQIINPSQFYFVDDGDCSDDFLELDFNLQKYFKQNASTSKSYSPNIDEIVAVFHVSEKRWFRAQVDEIYQARDGPSFILWTIDKGKSIVSKPDKIRSLPNQFKNVSVHNIYFAGLNNLLPAEKEFDFVSAESKMEISTKWSPKACKIFETLIQQAEHIYFIIKVRGQDQFFGDIEIITNLNKKKNISNVLIEASEAVLLGKKFSENLNNLRLNKQKRWLSTNGECHLLNHQNNMSSNIENNLPHIEEVTVAQSSQSQREFEKSNSEIHEKIQIWQQRNEKSMKERSFDILKPILDEEDDLVSNFDSVSVVNEKRTFEHVKKPDKILGQSFEKKRQFIDAALFPDDNMFKLVSTEDDPFSYGRMSELNNACGIAGLNITTEKKYDMNEISTLSKNRLLNERKALLKSSAKKFQISRKDEEKSEISDASVSSKNKLLAERLKRIRNSDKLDNRLIIDRFQNLKLTEKDSTNLDDDENVSDNTSIASKKRLLDERRLKIKSANNRKINETKLANELQQHINPFEKDSTNLDEVENMSDNTSIASKKRLLDERRLKIKCGNNKKINETKSIHELEQHNNQFEQGSINLDEVENMSDTSIASKKRLLDERRLKIKCANNKKINETKPIHELQQHNNQFEQDSINLDDVEKMSDNTSIASKKRLLDERRLKIKCANNKKVNETKPANELQQHYNQFEKESSNLDEVENMSDNTSIASKKRLLDERRLKIKCANNKKINEIKPTHELQQHINQFEKVSSNLDEVENMSDNTSIASKKRLLDERRLKIKCANNKKINETNKPTHELQQHINQFEKGSSNLDEVENMSDNTSISSKNRLLDERRLKIKCGNNKKINETQPTTKGESLERQNDVNKSEVSSLLMNSVQKFLGERSKKVNKPYAEKKTSSSDEISQMSGAKINIHEPSSKTFNEKNASSIHSNCREIPSTSKPLKPSSATTNSPNIRRNTIPGGYDIADLYKKENKSSNLKSSNFSSGNERHPNLKHSNSSSGNDRYSSNKNRGFNQQSDNENRHNNRNTPNNNQKEERRNSVRSSGSSRDNYQQQKRDITSSLSSQQYINNSYNLNQNGIRLEEINEVCISDVSQYSKDLVLVHGNHIPVPIFKLEKANFSKTVHEGLKRFRSGLSIYRTQQYSWQHILYGNSLILVNSARSGKTYSYLPAICSLIENENEDGEVPYEQGPICIILTSLRSDAVKIKDNCKPLICHGTNYSDHIVTYTCADNEAELTNALENLLAGRDILICTPKCLDKLFEQDDEKNYEYVNWFSKNRLKHVIIENYDLWNQEKRDILNKHMTNLQLKRESAVQIVITSNVWEPKLEHFFKLKSFSNPLLCIGAHLESAVYGGAKQLVKFVSKSHKINETISFIEKYGHDRLVIVCNDDNETNDVTNELKKCYLCTAVTNERTIEQTELLSKKWAYVDSEHEEILICSDEQLYDLRIKNANNLIHYSLTDMWSSFALRYSIFVKRYNDKLRESSARTKNNVPHTLILLDENNNSQLPKLVKFLGRNGCSIDPVIKTLAEKIENEKHSKLENVCTKFIEFGNFHNKDDCYEGRHTLTKRDESYSEIPNCGTIKYQIIHIFSPVHYSIRILGINYPETGDYVQYNKSSLYLAFSLKFSQHFSDTKNHIIYGIPKLNDRCTVQEGSHFYRAQILKIIQPNPNAILKRAKVECRLLDVGRIEIYPVDELFFLPPEFEEFPPQAIDLRLTGIVPYDEEDEWDGKLKITVKNWLNKRDAGDNYYFLSQIDFTFSNILFVQEIILTEIRNDIPIFRIFIKKNLIKKHLVLENSIIVSDLKNIANKMGILNRKCNTEENISTSNFTNCASSESRHNKNELKNDIGSDKKTTELSQQINSPFQRARPMRKVKNFKNVDVKSLTYTENWIKLSESSFTEVLCSSFYGPNELYVLIDDPYSRQMRTKLYDKINALVEEKPDNDLVPEIGINCIVKFKKYLERCKIIEVCNDLCEIKVKVYLVDVGATVKRSISELFPSNQDIVEFLPFQAVRCELVGGIWNDIHSDCIYDEIIEQYDNLFARPVKNVDIKNEEDILKYSTYGIILIGCNEHNYITINKKIIDSGYGVKDNDNEYLMDILFTPKVEDFEHENSNSSEENWNVVDNVEKFEYKPIVEEQNSNDSEKVFDVNFEPTELLELFGLPPTAKFLPFNDSEKNGLNEISCTDEKGIKSSKIEKKAKEKFEERNLIESQYNNVSYNNTSRSGESTYKHNDLIDNVSSESRDLKNSLEMPTLKTSAKSPSVIWQQSEDKIRLVISSPDIKDYYLNVTPTHLYFMSFIHDEKRELDLTFFGNILPDCTSHRLRGLNVSINLVKQVRGKKFMWPRLTEVNEKSFFIKYNTDAIDDKEVESQSKIQYDQCTLKTMEHGQCSDEDTSDSDLLLERGNFGLRTRIEKLYENCEPDLDD